MNWFYFSSPSTFYGLAGRLAPWCFVLAGLLAAWGLYLGLLVAPTDAQQGEVYRVIFIHVPTAWMSMFLYFVMACYCALTLVFNTRLSAMMARAIAPTGALFTFLALWTGAFWGRPTWGTYWVWDAHASPRNWSCSSSTSATSRSPTPSRTRAEATERRPCSR